MNYHDSFYNLAIHEAGHIVIAQINGINFEYIEVIDLNSGYGATKFVANGLKYLKNIKGNDYSFYFELSPDEVA